MMTNRLKPLQAVIFPLTEVEIEMEMEIFFLQKWKVRMEFNLIWN